MGCIEFHFWNVESIDFDYLDCMIFDFDLDFELLWWWVVDVMCLVLMVFDEFGLDVFLKISGGKGMYIVVFLVCWYGWVEVKVFSKGVV